MRPVHHCTIDPFWRLARERDSAGNGFAIAAMENRVTDLHRFKVGQSVRYRSSVRSGSNASFKILRLLPPEGDQRQYRIKSSSEAHERIAKESELNQEF